MVKLPDSFPAPEPVPFGKYELLGRAGRGGMADVYLARPLGQRRFVAIKCIKAKLADKQQFVDMFIQEGNLAVQLKHDAIVKTFEVGRIQGLYFICMEYISGVDLSGILKACASSNSRRLPVPHALFIAVRILEGLHYAHELTDKNGRSLNLVNRDVSPSNVRVAFDGEVKMLDFGIAKAASGLSSEIGVLKGKISHMSPEQVRGLPLDRRSDIFSTAVVIHEMLTGEKLFRGDSEFQVMDLVRKAEVRAPSQANPRVTSDLDKIVLRGLQKLPEHRYQTAEEMATDLRPILANYNFNRSELRDLVRDLCPDAWERDQQISQLGKKSSPKLEAEAKKSKRTDEEDYGELFVDLSIEEELSTMSGGASAKANGQPWWIWLMLIASGALLVLATVLVLAL
ncbi:MAG: serine/threonine protein kinase [Myxococcales bacterium]|nr:serine/threonine protein kinase [Myxococcales bacterium]